MSFPRYPALYEINTRVVLGELAARLDRPATLDDFSDEELEKIAAMGFDWIWFLGVWQLGPAGRRVSLSQPEWRQEYAATLPDFTDDDVSGSPFAIQSYVVDRDFGGDEALARLRERMRKQGLRLMLDFVPNHTALDHAWAKDHPEYFIQGKPGDVQREPANYVQLETHHGPVVFAHGRDPYFPGWPDTLQLNYRHAELRDARVEELHKIAGQCDGLRCDMAMLLLPDIFRKTWGDRSLPSDGTPPVDESFWPGATAAVRKDRAGFVFLAEVYWDLEWVLQQQGFTYTYDKRLYDRLQARDAGGVRGHLHAEPGFQDHSARFLENHDEPRAAATFAPGVHQAAAVVTYLVPGLRFFHEGQFEGRRVKVSMHLKRRPREEPDPVLGEFYRQLLDCLRPPVVREGRWRFLDCRQAWAGNPTWLCFIAFAWEGSDGERLIVTVNYGSTRGQCYVVLPFADLKGRQFFLRDLMNEVRYDRRGDDLAASGLYLDEAGWAYHVFELIGS